MQHENFKEYFDAHIHFFLEDARSGLKFLLFRAIYGDEPFRFWLQKTDIDKVVTLAGATADNKLYEKKAKISELIEADQKSVFVQELFLMINAVVNNYKVVKK